jgi:DNA-binding transcriptional LysR family regulator
MKYTLNQLHIFLKIVETGSITKAADLLHLTQPAVSIQLKNFQDQFDVPLTELIGRKLHITDFGKEVAQSAHAIIHEVNDINNKALSHKGLLTGRLKISVVSTGKYVMPYFLSSFMGRHPGVELVMDVTNKNKVVESLEKNEVDFALVSILPDKLPIEKLDLLQNKLFLVGKYGPLPPKGTRTKEIFNQLPLIFREPGSGTRQKMEQFIKQYHIPVVKKMELTSNEAVKQALLAGLGFSIMPLIGIRNEMHVQELRIIPVNGLPIKTTWSLIWNKGKKLSPVSVAYLQFLKREKSKIVADRFNWYEQF